MSMLALLLVFASPPPLAALPAQDWQQTAAFHREVTTPADIRPEPLIADTLAVSAADEPPPAATGDLTQSAGRAYARAVPRPARHGLRNMLRNLREPLAALNHLLQLKPRRALAALGRFALNSTIGVAGLMDVAEKRPFGLPYRANGFANTLAYYGVKPGRYMVLPLLGPTTLRDLLGMGLDVAAAPLSIGPPIGGSAYALSKTAVRTLDRYAEMDTQQPERALTDPAERRSAYLARREAEVAALHRPSDGRQALASNLPRPN